MAIFRLGQNAYEKFSIDGNQNIRFTETNYRSKGILVFSAKWCGHCKALAPILERLDVFCNGDVPIVKVDIEEDHILQKVFINNKLPINGFPTIYIMDVDGRVMHTPYQGPRTLEALYLQTQISTPCQKSCGQSHVSAHNGANNNLAPLWGDSNKVTSLSVVSSEMKPTVRLL